MKRDYDPFGDDGLLQPPPPPPRWFVVLITAAVVGSPLFAVVALWQARR